MASVSNSKKQRLFDPEEERERWRHVFFLELMKRPTARTAFDTRIRPLYAQLLRAVVDNLATPDEFGIGEAVAKATGKPADFFVRASAEFGVMALDVASWRLWAAWDGHVPDDGAEVQLLAAMEGFITQTLRCQGIEAIIPKWLFHYVTVTLTEGSPPGRPTAYDRTEAYYARDTDEPVSLPNRDRHLVELRPDPHPYEGARNPLTDVEPVRNELPLYLFPGQDIEAWKANTRRQLERLLIQMQAEAEGRFLYIRPSTAGKYEQDAKDLAMLCVYGSMPDENQKAREKRRHRLERFALFVGIECPEPRQKLTRKTA